VKRLAEDCCKYGVDNEHFGFALAKASVEFGNSHKQIEKEREDLLKVLGEQVMAKFHLLFSKKIKFSLVDITFRNLRAPYSDVLFYLSHIS